MAQADSGKPKTTPSTLSMLWLLARVWTIRSIAGLLPLDNHHRREIHDRLMRGEALDRSLFLPRLSARNIVRLIVLLVIVSIAIYGLLEVQRVADNSGQPPTYTGGVPNLRQTDPFPANVEVEGDRDG